MSGEDTGQEYGAGIRLCFEKNYNGLKVYDYCLLVFDELNTF